MSLGLQEKKKINPAPAATNHHSISSLESISYSPDVGTLILREVPNCRLSQTSVNKPASHHLAKLISFWNPVFYQEYALIVVFSVTGFCLTQCSIRLEKKKTLAFQSFIPVTGFVATTQWMFNFRTILSALSGSLGQSLVCNRWGNNC